MKWTLPQWLIQEMYLQVQWACNFETGVRHRPTTGCEAPYQHCMTLFYSSQSWRAWLATDDAEPWRWCQTLSGSFLKLHSGTLTPQSPPVEQTPWQALQEMQMLSSPSHPLSLQAEHSHLHSSAPVYQITHVTLYTWKWLNRKTTAHSLVSQRLVCIKWQVCKKEKIEINTT